MKGRRLHPPRNSRASAVWIQLYLHPISDEHFDAMQTHFSGQVRERDLAIRQGDAEERIRKSLFNNSFNDIRFLHICGAKNSSFS